MTVWIRAALVRSERVCSVCGHLVVIGHNPEGVVVILNQQIDVLAI